MEHRFIYSWSILSTIYIVENCIINLVWHILHRWLEIVILPVTFIWFLRYLKPRNYITIIINTKSLKIFQHIMWTQYVLTYWLIIHCSHEYTEHNYKYCRNNTKICKYSLGNFSTLNPHLSATFMIFNTNTVQGHSQA